MTVAEAYQQCREIARREAKNFYYAFVALPRHKRDAICAVYAFMRHADDISDDETLSPGERRIRMGVWLDEWHSASQGESTRNPVFLALSDAQARFRIPGKLLDQLVEGTTMDLRRASFPGQYDTYATFEDLYRYCYLVASVVGLVCIHIFGYSDPLAERLAEETGVAFQLTNILRDVREDVERKRVYLPLDEMRRYGVSVEDLAALPAKLTPNMRDLFTSMAARAEHYYASGYALLPLIDADSRAALWVLVTIYHRLLRRMGYSGYEVFARRAAVPAITKFSILLRGLGRLLLDRAGLRR